MSQRTTCACMPLKYRWCILVTLTSRQHFTLGLYTLKKVLCQCDQSAHQCITTTRHDASKVLSHLHELNPSATVLRIVCDGPTTQYRSKKNFFNLRTIPFQLEFQTITWNSWCLDMGKGPGDGSVQLWREKQIPYLQKKRTERTSVLRGTFKRAAKCEARLRHRARDLRKWIPCYQIVSRGSVEQWKYTRKYW